MTKGKPSVEEEQQLREMVQAKKPLKVIAKVLGKSEDCVKQKGRRLGLEVVVVLQIANTTTSDLELPIVEEAFKTLLWALRLLETLVGLTSLKR